MKKLTVILLLPLLCLPCYSQSVPDLISDLEEVSAIISDLETTNGLLNEQLTSLLRNETLKEKQLADLKSSMERQSELYDRLSLQLTEQAQLLQEQTKSYDLLSLRFKILSYCTVGVTALGVTGWILWAAGR